MNNKAKNFNTTKDDLVLINKLTKRDLSADEVFTFSVILCDNEIDRDFERFDDKSLQDISEIFVGKTGIFDHDVRSKNQTARIYSTEIIVSDEKQNSLGKPYNCVKAKAYMIKSVKNNDLMLEIDGGIKKEVSISCSVRSTICSICNTDLKDNSCSHKKGRTYSEAKCHYILSGITDAYEWSFVSVPAQKNAGVTKNFNPEEVILSMENRDVNALVKAFSNCPSNENIVVSKNEATSLAMKISKLEKSAEIGELYRMDLVKEVKKLSFLANEGISCEIINSVAEKMDIIELKAYKNAYELKLDKGNDVQLKSCIISTGKTADDFKM